MAARAASKRSSRTSPEAAEPVDETEKLTSDERPYVMTADLSVIESLGINLYSNAAAVLSELVANAYDADATEITINWKQGNQKIVVADNGTGMNRDEINKRFLKVGYKKRDNEGTASQKWKRPFMGRKGIGKLSVFSIANSVSVYSKKGSELNGLRIDVKALEQDIRKGNPYFPERVTVPAAYRRKGTTIVLDDLKRKRANLTAAALKKRLARRFDVLDQTPKSEGGFHIKVNGRRVKWADRQELKKLEFIWEFGKEELPDHALPPDIKRFTITDNEVKASTGWKVKGWFGTAKRPTDLTSDREAGSLKNIIVLARKRPIQEGIIEKLDFSRIFGNYVTGQVEADFLDLDGDYDDIATSDRQRLIEDDDRVVALQDFLRKSFVAAAEQWSKARPKKQAKDVLERFPKMREWVEARPPYQKEAAEVMIGTIAGLELEKNAPENRADLFRSGVLAFERIGLRQTTTELDRLSAVTANDLLPLLGQQDEYEAGLWVDILRSRIEAIEQFRNLTRANEKEKVLQRHLYKNLWLIDPSWERAATGGKMEEDLRRVYPGLFAEDKGGQQIKGRFDIRYGTASGRHVIVELKRYSVRLDVETLYEQGLKYFNALSDLLRKTQAQDRHVELVFVLGDEPRAKDAPAGADEDKYIRDRLSPISGRIVLYDALIRNAQHQYQQYLDASDKARALEDLLGTLDDSANDV